MGGRLRFLGTIRPAQVGEAKAQLWNKIEQSRSLRRLASNLTRTLSVPRRGKISEAGSAFSQGNVACSVSRRIKAQC